MLHNFSAVTHQLFLIIIVRWVVIITSLLLSALNSHFWHFAIAETAMSYALMIYTGFALISLARILMVKQSYSFEVGLQLGVDLCSMFVLFYLSGGAANPFVSFLLFPLVVSAAVLNRMQTYGLLALALLLYGLLFLLPDPLVGADQVDHSLHAGHSHHQAVNSAESDTFSLHVLGMWVNFAIVATLVCTVVVMMAKRLKDQAHKETEQREDALKREQLLAIATEAASVAHHMGTPLSTIAIIAHELKTMPECEAAKEEIEVLQSQVELCKKELAQLRSKAEVQRYSLPQHLPVLSIVAEIRQEFQLLRPQANTLWKIADNLASVTILSTPSLRLAILNLMNNASDAAPEPIVIEVYSAQDRVFVDIFDQGPGIDAALSGDIRQPVKSRKHESVGLGLYLSHASINQVNGVVELSNIEPTGTLTRVMLPIVHKI